MISHVFLPIGDFGRAYRFHAAIMAALGHAPRFCDEARPWAAWQPAGGGRPLFIIGSPYNGGAPAPGNGPMTALLAPSRAAVDAAHAAALANGGCCEGPPGLRPQYHPDYYGAYFRDPDGNKIGVCCHAPVQEP
ncbi:Catechol 2,3-dioxygenase [Duganella sp. CF458]|uniref:VOC family protein n=1 Tax=Duganella sp. CF458 TaxID=1884368 RepID=UPI0008EA95F2|nr:VOC family protein [Duganella sp. CF458]SFG27336.1 Catechol 2,3-dioxygenase [Duganella sp. CF458]